MATESQVRATGFRDPDTQPATEPRFTPQQEREMGVRDDNGHTIQPTSAALMIGAMYMGLAAVAVVIAIVVFRVLQ